MSYYKIKSVNIRNENSIIVTAASSNVTPTTYKAIIYNGNIEDFFKELLGGELQFNQSNRQVAHEAFLRSLVHLQEKGLSVQDLWDTEFTCDNYKEAFDVFKNSLKSGKDNRDYYLQIDGREFFCWNKYGYKYSAGGQKKKRSYIDVLLAKTRYMNVTYQLAED